MDAGVGVDYFGGISQLLNSITPMIAAIGFIYLSLQQRRASDDNRREVAKVAAVVDTVHTNTNSMNEKMEKLAKAAGILEGIAQERDRMIAETALKALGAKEAEERSVGGAGIVAGGGAVPVVIQQPAGESVPVKVDSEGG